MYKETSRLLLYGGSRRDGILEALCAALEAKKRGEDRFTVVRAINACVRGMVELAVRYGLDGNLWQDCLALRIATDENPFSLACERRGSEGAGGTERLAKRDLAVFLRLFRYDFSKLESELGLDCFSAVSDFRLPAGCAERRPAGERITALARDMAAAEDEEEAYRIVTEFYRRYGAGIFALDRAFRLDDAGELVPARGDDSARLSDIVGCERQKAVLIENTEAFVSGRSANNVLLYGDSGTGKSTSVRAVINEYAERGLRAVEIYKHQFGMLAPLMSRLRERNYRFVVFIDDLSFEEHEVEYKFLKAVIEGGIALKPENVLIYATSNRRHLIRETWNDRSDMEHDGDIHRSDTMEEKLSLAERFGILINFSTPAREEFYEIVRTLAARRGIEMDEKTLLLEANRWEIRHGGVSGRTAQQFVDMLAAKNSDRG